MGMVGDVVFCVDRDLARSAHMNVAVGSAGGTVEAPPRRMATKKDASGDALCAACLDARLLRRRAEFVLHQGRGTAPAAPPPAASSQSSGAPVRKLSAIRIARTRSDEVAPKPAEKARANAEKARANAEKARVREEARATAKAANKARAAEKAAAKKMRAAEQAAANKARVMATAVSEAIRSARASNADDRKQQARFLHLAADIGLVRAHELLSATKTGVRAITGRS